MRTSINSLCPSRGRRSSYRPAVVLYVYHTLQSCAACLETHKCGIFPWSGVKCESPLTAREFRVAPFFGACDGAFAQVEEEMCGVFPSCFFLGVEKRAAASLLGDMRSLLRDIFSQI